MHAFISDTVVLCAPALMTSMHVVKPSTRVCGLLSTVRKTVSGQRGSALLPREKPFPIFGLPQIRVRRITDIAKPPSP